MALLGGVARQPRFNFHLQYCLVQRETSGVYAHNVSGCLPASSDVFQQSSSNNTSRDQQDQHKLHSDILFDSSTGCTFNMPYIPNTPDATVDPMAEWGTKLWDDTLLALGRMTKQAEPTGLLVRDFQTINELLNSLSFVISKFKLVREIELQSNDTKRVSMVTTFFTPTIAGMERSMENFAADRLGIIARYQVAMKRLNPASAGSVD